MTDKRVNRTWSSSKLSFCEVKERFKECGMEVLSEVYVDSKTPLNVRCNNGHEFGYTIAKLKTAKCCVICRREGEL